MPPWLLALQLAIQLEPELAQAIQIAKAPALTEDQMNSLLATMDKALADYQAAIAKS